MSKGGSWGPWKWENRGPDEMTCSFRFLAGEPGAAAGRGVSQLPGLACPTCLAPEPLCPAIWSPTAGLLIDRMALL
jgi:hypothetical protein